MELPGGHPIDVQVQCTEKFTSHSPPLSPTYVFLMPSQLSNNSVNTINILLLIISASPMGIPETAWDSNQ